MAGHTEPIAAIRLSFDYQFTESPGHGIELAKTAASDGYRYLVAVGGDGTIMKSPTAYCRQIIHKRLLWELLHRHR